mmetsp:Transcript_3490/g.7576  ORF Transcript_3490/g.7576 Transcript_3490/m.7576 type:complete len:226 (+) Transcript_3490:346-1023(+)
MKRKMLLPRNQECPGGRATATTSTGTGECYVPSTTSTSTGRGLLLLLLTSLLAMQQVSSQLAFGDVVAAGCKSFNMTTEADSILTIRHFSAYFDTTACLRTTISAYDESTGIWSLMCTADVRGGGSVNVTIIPESACIPHVVLPGETAIFKIEYASCSDNCTSPCDCEAIYEIPLGELDEHYWYTDQLCDADGTCVEDPVVDVIAMGYLMGNSSAPSQFPSMATA